MKEILKNLANGDITAFVQGYAEKVKEKLTNGIESLKGDAIKSMGYGVQNENCKREEDEKKEVLEGDDCKCKDKDYKDDKDDSDDDDDSKKDDDDKDDSDDDDSKKDDDDSDNKDPEDPEDD